MKKICIAFLAILNFLHIASIKPCTGIGIKATNNALIYARTLEFAQPLDSNILFVPRNYSFTGTAPDGSTKGLSWKSKHAVIGANAFGLTHFVDGVNEKGLAGGLFYFPEYAQYQTISQKDIARSLGSWELLTFLLTSCATTQEAQQILLTIFVSNVALKLNNQVQPIHLIVHDAQGNCIVIEYVKGNVHVYENPLRIITNSPTFDWHITNLRNYINLSNINVPQVKIGNISLVPTGQGSGMLGLPGDFTPPSRFVRAVAFSQSSVIPHTESEAIDTAFHLLNLFDIPRGSVRQKEKTSMLMESTQWTSASDTKNHRYYFHTYRNRTIRMADLHAFNVNAQTISILPMEIPPSPIPSVSTSKILTE